jgi:tRNA pseudouridine38-40 synthase
LVTNYKIIVHFDGTRFSGWQFQAPPLKTIQGELMRALQIIAKHRVIVTGSSRTDAGVHSAGLAANFHLKIKIAPESLKKALNSLLTEDIRIMECEVLDKSFNARFSAKRKVYVYRIYFGQTVSPFICRYMVRNIIGTIIDVGRGKLKPGDIPAIFEAKDRKKAGQVAPPKGLTLAKVIY